MISLKGHHAPQDTPDARIKQTFFLCRKGAQQIDVAISDRIQKCPEWLTHNVVLERVSLSLTSKKTGQPLAAPAPTVTATAAATAGAAAAAAAAATAATAAGISAI